MSPVVMSGTHQLPFASNEPFTTPVQPTSIGNGALGKPVANGANEYPAPALIGVTGQPLAPDPVVNVTSAVPGTGRPSDVSMAVKLTGSAVELLTRNVATPDAFVTPGGEPCGCTIA